MLGAKTSQDVPGENGLAGLFDDLSSRGGTGRDEVFEAHRCRRGPTRFLSGALECEARGALGLDRVIAERLGHQDAQETTGLDRGNVRHGSNLASDGSVTPVVMADANAAVNFAARSLAGRAWRYRLVVASSA